jgi:radical SAM-linked protein
VALASSQGYHPHPLLKAQSALPLGVESLVESLLVTVQGRPELQNMMDAVNLELPQGLHLAEGRLGRAKEPLPEPAEVSYHLRTGRPLDPARLAEFQRREVSLFQRVTPKGGREIDMKAAILEMRIEGRGLFVRVGRAGGRPKPMEILSHIFGLSQQEALAARALKVGAKDPERS